MLKFATFAIVLATALVQPQVPAPQSPVSFEVASVKRNTSGDTRTWYQTPPNGTVNITNATVGFIIRAAYEIDLTLERFTIVAPANNPLMQQGRSILDQMNLPHFDVQGKIPEGTPPGQQFAMLRTLLAERFKLRAHKEVRPTPVYALTIARPGRLGPNLRPSIANCMSYGKERLTNAKATEPRGADGTPLCTGSGFPQQGVMTHRGAGSMNDLVRSLQSAVDRPLVDETGLSATFEWKLSYDFAPSETANGVGPIFRAIQEQLGLKLEPRTGSFEVLVIDSVEMPSEN